MLTGWIVFRTTTITDNNLLHNYVDFNGHSILQVLFLLSKKSGHKSDFLYNLTLFYDFYLEVFSD